MALDYNTSYPAKTTAPSADYPQGGPQDITTPGDGTGTPWTAAVIGDLWGWFQGLIARAGITVSGSPDTAQVSDGLDAIEALLGYTLELTTDALGYDLAGVESFETRGYAVAGDLGAARWAATGNTVPGSAGTIDVATGLLYDVNGLEFEYNSPEITFEAFGLDYANVATYHLASAKSIKLLDFQTYALGSTAIIVKYGCRMYGNAFITYTGAAKAIRLQGDAKVEGFSFSSTTAAVSISVEGNRCTVRDILFQGNKASGIHVDFLAGGYDSRVERIQCVKTTANAFSAVKVGAPRVYIDGVTVETAGGVFYAVEIPAFTLNVSVGGLAVKGTPAGPMISDPGPSKTIYRDLLRWETPPHDISTGLQWFGTVFQNELFLERVTVLATQATVGSANFAVGYAGAPGVLTAWLTDATTAGMSQMERQIVTLGGGEYMASGVPVYISNTGNATSGHVVFVLEFLPYRGTN